MNKNKTNPLINFTRREVVYITLPSKQTQLGENLSLTTSGEIGIKPMTTADEISLTTPEALFNGEALINIIKSCVPAIVDPKKILAPDIDAILVAIRLASYGDKMEISVKCPKCEEENYFDTSIKQCIDNMEYLEDEYKLTLSDNVSNIIVTVTPFTFEQNIKEALYQFNETKALDYVIQKDFKDDDELKSKYNKIVSNIANNNLELISNCISTIHDKDGNLLEVTNSQICEWLKQLPAVDAKQIIKKISTINKIGIHKELKVKCSKCKHDWEAELNFDPANFFVKGS